MVIATLLGWIFKNNITSINNNHCWHGNNGYQTKKKMINGKEEISS